MDRAGHSPARRSNALHPPKPRTAAQKSAVSARNSRLPVAQFINLTSGAATDTEASLQPTPLSSTAPSTAATPGRPKRQVKSTAKFLALVKEKLQAARKMGSKTTPKTPQSGSSSARTTPASGPSTRPPSPPPLTLDASAPASPSHTTPSSTVNTPARRERKAWSKYGEEEVVDSKAYNTAFKAVTPKRRGNKRIIHNTQRRAIYYDGAFDNQGQRPLIQVQSSYCDKVLSMMI